MPSLVLFAQVYNINILDLKKLGQIECNFQDKTAKLV